MGLSVFLTLAINYICLVLSKNAIKFKESVECQTLKPFLEQTCQGKGSLIKSVELTTIDRENI